MKNSTLGRKPGNDMKANASTVKPRMGADQRDSGLASSGMAGDGVNRMKNDRGYCHNPYTIGDKSDRINKGLMQSQRKGNASSAPDKVGPSVTKDPHKLTIATAAQGGRIDGGATVKCFPGYPDKINVGMK